MNDTADAGKARAIAEDAPTRECLFLIGKGIPFDVAFSLDATVRLAWCVALGEFDGGSFDWDRLEWDKRDG